MTFDDLEIGQVISLGAIALDRRAIESFCTTFAPDWDPMNGAPDAMVYAIWSRLEADSGKSNAAASQAPGGRRAPAGCAIRRRASCCGAGA